MLKSIVVGIVGASFMRGGTALAAVNRQAYAEVLEKVEWPAEFPFSKDDFRRYDEQPDAFFYNQPRLVTHIDNGAITAIRQYYEKVFPPSGRDDVALLDMCSSWISHYPKEYTVGKITGLGMNKDELSQNPILTDYDVKDLNEDPTLPYPDNTYDVITNAVSVDYLSKPLEVFKEMHRVLKPGGKAIMSFSNRCFPTKAIAVWTATNDMDHAYIVGAYFHYSVPGGWTKPESIEISLGNVRFGSPTDPMYVVTAKKLA